MEGEANKACFDPDMSGMRDTVVRAAAKGSGSKDIINITTPRVFSFYIPVSVPLEMGERGEGQSVAEIAHRFLRYLGETPSSVLDRRLDKSKGGRGVFAHLKIGQLWLN